MSATEALTREHRIIERALRVLERLTDEDSPAVERLEGVVEVLRVVGDRCHHGKEEQVLFPALAEVGHGPQDGPVGAMLVDHEEGRALLTELEDEAVALRAGRGDPRRIARAGARYAALLRDHIEREDEVLFPMADELLAGREDELQARYAEIERLDVGEELLAGALRLLEALEANRQEVRNPY